MIAVSSAAFSTMPTPNRKFFFDMMNFAVLGSSSPKMSMPLVCSSVAPVILPMPMVIILTMPLSIGARKFVCGLMRQTKHDAVGSGRELVHVDGHAVDLAQFHHVHLRLDGAADEALGDAVALQHLALAFGRGAAVAAHGGEDEGLGAQCLELGHHLLHAVGDVGDAAAAHSPARWSCRA